MFSCEWCPGVSGLRRHSGICDIPGFRGLRGEKGDRGDNGVTSSHWKQCTWRAEDDKYFGLNRVRCEMVGGANEDIIKSFNEFLLTTAKICNYVYSRFTSLLF